MTGILVQNADKSIIKCYNFTTLFTLYADVVSVFRYDSLVSTS